MSVAEPISMTSGARNSLIAVSTLWVFFAVTVVFRFMGRIRGIGVGLDDVLSAVACILSSAMIGLNGAVIKIGVGWNLDPDSAVYMKLANNLPVIMQINFTFTLIYIWCLATLKMSQLALYIRIFSNQLQLWVCLIGGVVIISAVLFNFLFIFLCDPISQQWTVERVGHCMDQILLLKCLVMTNLITDLCIVVLPIKAVWKLQMRRIEKFAVLACFSLGGACVIISLARFIQIYTIDLIGNLTGTSLTALMLCSIELMLEGLCINIPMLRPFYVRLRTKYKPSSIDGPGGLSSNKQSRSRQPGVASARHGHYTAWIELADKEQKSDDTSSERNLTANQPDDAIHVQRDWAIDRT